MPARACAAATEVAPAWFCRTRRIVDLRPVKYARYVVRGRVPKDVSCIGAAYGAMQSATRDVAIVAWIPANRGHRP
jgi:hypothetical protein